VPRGDADPEDGPPPFDEAAESAFLAETRERGDVVPQRPAATAAVDETSTTPLPGLDPLVERIPVSVRETLDELFRARFVAVKRLPKDVLDSARN
jgi:hypothetical protein